MATHPKLSSEELSRRWAERVTSGTFSAGVLGLGTIRIMGKSGDTPLQFPRITSLDALSSLAPDEQWALQAVQTLVSEAPSQRRAVFAVVPGEASQPERITSFDPIVESLIVVSRVAGG